MTQNPKLISSLLLPELERQLKEDKNLWPNVKGLFIVTVTKKKKAEAIWYKMPIRQLCTGKIMYIKAYDIGTFYFKVIKFSL